MATTIDNMAGVSDRELDCARMIWDYMKLNQPCDKSDVILCLGSYDVRAAEKAASLWLQGMGKYIVFSGNAGHLTQGIWDKPEADVFRERALVMGVPDENILVENKSTNSGENIKLSYELLSERKQLPNSVIIVQKPYMERRAYATFVKQWPGDVSHIGITVTSPDIDLLDYPNEAIGSLADVIDVMVGDFARIRIYEEKGFHIHQEIPEMVQEAFDYLIETKKYCSHLPK